MTALMNRTITDLTIRMVILTLLYYYLNTFKSSMNFNFNFNFPFQLFITLLLPLLSFTVCNGGILTERDALVAVKNGLSDPSGRLSAWIGDDCCQWTGIECDNETGNVVKLDLRNPFQLTSLDVYSLSEKELEDYRSSCLGGELNSSLLHLKYLNYLDLSLNNFEGVQIPEFLGSLHNLRYLNLSYSSFTGNVPPQFGDLSNLQYLDLNGDSALYVDNPEWLSGLYNLKYLDFGSVQINSTQGVWLNAINRMPFLLELHLHECGLADILITLPFVNFTSLSVLDLSKNSFNSSIPEWLFNLTRLSKLDLSSNSFSGSIPSDFANLVSLQDLDLSLNTYIGGQLLTSSFGNLCNLKSLKLAANKFDGQISEFLSGFSVCSSPKLVTFDLNSNQFSGELPDLLVNMKNLRVLDFAYNSFWGSIPSTIGNLSSLQVLYLHSNKMNGSIPKSFGQLSKLVDLNLNANSWEGVMTEVHLMNLSSLETILLSTDTTKSLTLSVSRDWIPPFKLKFIQLENCRVGPFFPMFLQVQSELTQVTLVNAGIADTIPEEWFSKLSSHLITLDLSDNRIKGKLPLELEFPKLELIDLSVNEFEGPLPRWSTNVTQFYLQYNKFSGSIPENIGELMPRLRNLHLSDNVLNGTIPSTICQMMDLQVLALRNNKLHGELIDCWETMQSLWVLDASNNSLSGRIPATLGYVRPLGMLLLSNNNLDGEIPSSLQNCSVLSSIDLGGNRLSGQIPSWIGVNVSSVFMLRLRSNMLDGHIPRQICSLQFLHFLDLSHNNFSGMIPSCMDNLTALIYGNSSEQYYTNFQYRLAYFKEQTMVVTKGREYEFSSNIAFMNAIDLSQNNLEGKIPDGITSLEALVLLNLSSNHLSGSIPAEIGNLKMLETFDLSHNNFSGRVPDSLSSLTFVSHLDLSYNNLSGKIPTGNQLQSLNASLIYEGNPFVCGFPLQAKCPGEEANDDDDDVVNSGDEDEDDDSTYQLGLHVSIGIGLVVGFLGAFFGTLRTNWFSWHKAK